MQKVNSYEVVHGGLCYSRSFFRQLLRLSLFRRGLSNKRFCGRKFFSRTLFCWRSFQKRLFYGELGNEPMSQREMQVADEFRVGFGNHSLSKHLDS